jgi:HSP20 family protein
MTLMKWHGNPDFLGLKGELERVFNEVFGERDIQTSPMNWHPRVDIHETESEIVIDADIPGVEKSDIKVTMQEGILTISGEKKIERENKDKNFHRIERFAGSYARSFQLPQVDPENIKASYKDGVLQVKLVKKLENIKKEIHIDIG